MKRSVRLAAALGVLVVTWLYREDWQALVAYWRTRKQRAARQRYQAQVAHYATSLWPGRPSSGKAMHMMMERMAQEYRLAEQDPTFFTKLSDLPVSEGSPVLGSWKPTSGSEPEVGS